MNIYENDGLSLKQLQTGRETFQETAIHTCGSRLKKFYVVRINTLVSMKFTAAKENSRKRKLEETGEIPSTKNRIVKEQTGVVEMEKPEEHKDVASPKSEQSTKRPAYAGEMEKLQERSTFRSAHWG